MRNMVNIQCIVAIIIIKLFFISYPVKSSYMKEDSY